VVRWLSGHYVYGWRERQWETEDWYETLIISPATANDHFVKNVHFVKDHALLQHQS
jgi:hypothetical protein